MTPSLTNPQVATSLVAFALVYALIFVAGTVYIYRVLKLGPVSLPDDLPADANPKRPLAIQGDAAIVQPEHRLMIEFWAAALALTLLLYVVLDGFDLGVGMLFPFAPGEDARRHMLAAISPVWDGNETWLVVSAAVLFGAFPLVYSLLLSAFYLPLLIMLCALILRGVAFEFRAKAGSFMRWVWDAGFVGGSYAASFVQGMTVGALVQGLPVTDGRYTGGAFGWLGALPLLCGFGLCLGYCLLGAGWLSYRTSQDVHDLAYRWLPRLLVAVGAFLLLAFVLSLALELRVMHRWIERPVLIVFPLAGAAGLRRDDPVDPEQARSRALPLHHRALRHGLPDPGDVLPALYGALLRDHRAGRSTAFRASPSCSGAPGSSSCR